MNAIDKAKALYAKHGGNFEDTLTEHLLNGIVISSPLWFLMLKAVELETGGKAWLIECAVGNMKSLASIISIELPYIAFCRVKNGKKKFKVYKTDRLLRLAQKEIAIP
jgi:hypothetical protein